MISRLGLINQEKCRFFFIICHAVSIIGHDKVFLLQSVGSSSCR